jgi:tryptophan synthase beta chain
MSDSTGDDSVIEDRGLLPRLGAFGRFGGRYSSELLWPALAELAEARERIVGTPSFQQELGRELARWAGRPTPLCSVPRFSAAARLDVWLKREDLLHGGAHKANNAVGQALLAQRLGKRRLIAETGAGQHGAATAMAGARLGMQVAIYMGARDAERQAQNVQRMELCGAEVVRVHSGSATLKDAINAALRDWAASMAGTHYVLGSVCGPDPFPALVRDLQAVIGREAKAQWAESAGGLPDAVIACVGGGSNAIGVFSAFVADESVQLLGAEAGGEGPHRHGATLARGNAGLLHGARTFVLQDEDGQIRESHSIAAGLDYPGVGPEHAALQERGRARYVAVEDRDAVAASALLCRGEGIVPALESAHALALCLQAVDRGLLPAGARVLVNLSGRGDKDLATLAARTDRERSNGAAGGGAP